MDKVYIKTLIDRVDSMKADHKKVERKELDDYLKEKHHKGLYTDCMISFNDSADKDYFEKLIDRLGLDISDILG